MAIFNFYLYSGGKKTIVLAKCADDTLELSVFGIISENTSVREIKLDHLTKSMRRNIILLNGRA